MEIFGYTIIKTCELRHQQFTQKKKHDAEIKNLNDKIVQLENKVDNLRKQQILSDDRIAELLKHD